MSKRVPMLRSALLLTLANFAMRGVSMIFQVYLTGQVGAAGVGLLQLIMTVHAFSVTVGTSGIRVAAMYLSAEEYGLDRSYGVRQAMAWCLGAGTALSTLVGAAMALGANSLALNWVGDLRSAASLRLLGLTLPMTAVSSILAGYFTACGKVGRLVIVEILDRIAAALLTMWLLNMGIPGDLSHACVSIVAGGAAASLGSVVTLLLLMMADFRRIAPAPESMHMGRRLLHFCLPVAFNDYLRSGLGTLEQFLIPYGLSRCGGSRTQALADYGTIHGMVFPVMMFPSTVLYAVADLLVPRLARSKARQDTARTQNLVSRCLQSSVFFSSAVGGLLYVLSEPLGLGLYGSADATRYLRLFAPLVPMLYLDCIVDGMHKGLGEQIFCVRVNTLTNLMDVIGLFFLLPRFGIGGYFFTYTFTHAVNFYLSLRRLLVISGVRIRWRFPLTAAGCVLLAIRVCSLLPAGTGWGAAAVHGGIYLTVLALSAALFPGTLSLRIDKSDAPA